MARWDDPKSEECDCCGWKTEALTQTDAFARTQGHGPGTPREEKEWAWLCEVCRSTMAGNSYLYPRQYPDATVLQMLAWQTNYLASLIKERS